MESHFDLGLNDSQMVGDESTNMFGSVNTNMEMVGDESTNMFGSVNTNMEMVGDESTNMFGSVNTNMEMVGDESTNMSGSVNTNMEMLDFGASFNSFEELKTAISNYERKVNANYNIHRSDALKNCTEQMKNQYIYKRICYICKQGGIFKTKGKGLRNSKSLRQNCTSNFVVKLIKRGTNQLVVTRFHDTHNHELDSNLFKRLFKQRKLNDKEKEYIIAGLKYDGNISKIQSDIQKLGKFTTKRDLYNLKKYMIPMNYQP
ncbi:uncharacterized protein LOC135931303 isoform X3 [Gordionus sp. m RMFG-2023]|uniref:uncharacterized protein LOC135931303 isoform X3 n=1 Tax=Gordionus sp. m RMFG-2023 TaxID=3053472 RepID=UPI0031FCFD61